ncbi:MAG: nitroreductase family protein [Dehalococcoidales bacterium]
MFKELVLQNRTYRRFDQAHTIDEATLRELVDLARNVASASNRQPLKYILSCDPEKNARIFPQLGFAGALKEWPNGPAEGERPVAYIVILLDTQIAKATDCDHGVAAQTILLGASEKGLGGCMHGSTKKDALRQAINIPEQYEILLVISLGKPSEKVFLEPLPADGAINYWRDAESGHHVPKRALNDIIIG